MKPCETTSCASNHPVRNTDGQVDSTGRLVERYEHTSCGKHTVLNGDADGGGGA